MESEEESDVTEEYDAANIQAPPSGGSNRRVLLGCGIGCGLLIFVLVILIAATFFLGNRALTTMDELSKPYLEREYTVWKDEGIIKAEQTEVYDALYDTVYDEQLGSRWVTICALFIMVYHTEDGAVTDEEVVQAQTLLDDIREQPGLGFAYWGEFMQSDEGLQEISQKVPLLVQK